MNEFQGGSEHEMKTMISALLDMKSRVSSEKFHCSFISDLVCSINKLIKSTNEKESREGPDSRIYSTDLSYTEVEDILNLDSFDDKIEEMEKLMSEEEIVAMEIDSSSRSKMIKISDGGHVFLSQLESCIHRGEHFE